MAASKVSMTKYSQLKKRLEGMNKKRMQIKAVADEKVERLIHSFVVGGAGLGVGFLTAKTGKQEISGIPIELLIAGFAHGLGMMDVGGKHSAFLHSFGDGCVAVAMSKVGTKLANEGFKGLIPKVSGDEYLLSGQRLTDEELEALSR